ncbi:MAG: AMP-binding protein [Acidimicrobiales bacterium]|nr:AMP-binding protein [Acidimicrobiales bacterium]
MAPRTLADLVVHAAHTRPTGEGIIGLVQRFSWPEVERRIRKLAQLLIANGVARGDRVGVMRPKGHESFEAVHAILRAGAIMVPFDPMAPAEAVAAVLDDSGVSAIIGHAPTIKRSNALRSEVVELVMCTGNTETLNTDAVVIGIDDLDPAAGDDGFVEFPAVEPDDPAYLIYTSGSTGTPKGILHTHASGLAYAEATVREHSMTAEDRVAAMTGLHFDMSTFELYAAPLAAAAIVQMSEPHLRFPASFTERAAHERTTMWYAVTFLLQQILERGALDQRNWSSLRMVMFAGEVFPSAALRTLMSALPRAEFVNVYGPAEVNASNTYTLTGPPVDGEMVPIGPGLADAEMRVVDDLENPVPPGTKGILWISARTRMREYWNRPDLTEETRRPRQDGPDWYITGDVVHVDEEGIVWFHGRSDHQVKLRGIRVELEGVESTLTNHPQVLHAVAGPWGGEPGTLAVTAVLSPGTELDLRSLQRWAAKKLPSVAIPAHMTVAHSLPQTASGKIDRKTIRAELARIPEET